MYERISSPNGKFESIGGYSNSKIFAINEKKAARYKTNNITDIIFVFDVDNQRGVNSDIIDVELFKKSISRMQEALETVGITYSFVPVVYCAETLELLQLYAGNLDIIKLVNMCNTKKLHKDILSSICDCSSDEVKSGMFLDYDILKERLENYKRITKFNKYCVELILDKQVSGLTRDEIIEYIIELRDYYAHCLNEMGINIKYGTKLIEVLHNDFITQFDRICSKSEIKEFEFYIMS
jgi:hypothetical protein